MIEIILDVHYVAVFMFLFMAIGIFAQRKKTGYNWLLFSFYMVLCYILFASWNTKADLSYRFPALAYFDTPFAYFLGPIIYFLFSYTHSRGFEKKMLLHFIPGIASALLTLPFYFLPAEIKADHLQAVFALKEIKIYDIYYGGGMFFSSGYVFYLLFSYRHLLKIDLIVSDHNLQFLAFLLFSSLAVVFFTFVGFFMVNYFYFRIATLIIAVSLHLYFILGFRTPSIHMAMVALSAQRQTPQSRLSVAEKENLKLLLEEKIKNEKLYLDESLSLNTVAVQVGVSIHQLSDYLNNELGQNFKQYVNQFRIQEAQNEIIHSDLNFLDIAYKVGFNSKATFNRVFKQMTGRSPKEFKSEHNHRNIKVM